MIGPLTPRTEAEVREVLSERYGIKPIGGNSSKVWHPGGERERLSVYHFDHIVDFRPDDLVVRVGAGVLLDDLDDMLLEKGLCIPILREKGWLGYPGKTVGGLVAMGLPHYGFGSVRDFVLGMRFMTGAGEIVESGANVVKSVAGFDLHRMMVGSRGGLGVILEVVLRLYPRRMMPVYEGEGVFDPCWVHRVPKSFPCDSGVRHGEFIWSDKRLDIPPDGWALGPNGARLGKTDPIAKRFRANLKNELDPKGVLIEGWQK